MKNILAILGILISFSPATAGNGSGTMMPASYVEQADSTTPVDEVEKGAVYFHDLDVERSVISYSMGAKVNGRWVVVQLKDDARTLKKEVLVALQKSLQDKKWVKLSIQ